MPLDQKSVPPISTSTLVGLQAHTQERFAQPLTLFGAHGSIVKLKMQVADFLSFLVPDLTIGSSMVGKIYGDWNFRDIAQAVTKHLRRWELERRLSISVSCASDV